MPFSNSNRPVNQETLWTHPSAQSDGAVMEHHELSLLEQTFRMLPDVVSIYDVAAHRVVYSNRSLACVLGYQDDATVGEWLLHPDDVARVNDYFHRLLQANDDETVDVTYHLKHADGSWQLFFERQVVFKRHEDGSVAQILKTTRYADESLNSQPLQNPDPAHTSTELNLPNSAFMLYDGDLRYILAEGDLLRRLGYTKIAMEGRTIHEVLPREIADWVEPAYRSALAGTEAQIEMTAGGTIISVRCLPVRNEHGEIMAGMVLAEDIADRKQATAALVESEQRFAQFSENMHALFWMMDTERKKPLYFSPAFNNLLEFKPELAYENPLILLDVIHPDDRQMVVDTFEQTFANGYHEIKFRILLPSGKLRWLSSRAFPIYDDVGNLYRVAGIADDITQHMEMEKITFDLAVEREHMRLLSQFIGTTSHELRTPLTIINTSLYLMKKTNDPVKQAERLQIIEHQVAQLARLISQMYMLLRVESINASGSTHSVSLNKILAKLEQDYVPAITKKELTLELVFSDDVPNIDVDPDLVLVALQNVFENAINYTNTGMIRAQTAAHGNEIILTVEDSGVGIDAEDLPHIFERFYKVEKNKKRTTVAAGLGLAITRRIIELSGGRVEVESQVEQGSTFRLIWPLKQ